MIFTNLTTFTAIFIGLLLVVGFFYFFQIFKSRGKSISFFSLVLVYTFVVFSILGIRGPYVELQNSTSGANILFAIDVSTSMNTQDILNDTEYISRLSSVKEYIYGFLGTHSTNNYALVAFTSQTLELLPFTNEIDLYNSILSSTDNTNLSKGGTDLTQLFSSLDLYFTEDEGDIAKTIVVFTDGGDNIALDAIYESINILKNKGVNIVLIGVGTTTGARIPLGIDPFGNEKYKKYQGEYVVSTLNKNIIEGLGDGANIEYDFLSNIDDYSKISSTIQKNIILTSNDSMSEGRLDISYILIILAFIFFVIYLGIEFLRIQK